MKEREGEGSLENDVACRTWKRKNKQTLSKVHYLKALLLKNVLDTTGAGDAFNGALAYALSKNKTIEESLNLANKVAGLSTTKHGAGVSMPLLSDID